MTELTSGPLDGGGWRIVVHCDPWRPPTNNRVMAAGHRRRMSLKKTWRDAATIEAQHAKAPRYAVPVELEAVGAYRKGPLPDWDALALAVKWCQDGLILAGVLADDTRRHVTAGRLLAPHKIPDLWVTAALVIGLQPATL